MHWSLAFCSINLPLNALLFTILFLTVHHYCRLVPVSDISLRQTSREVDPNILTRTLFSQASWHVGSNHSNISFPRYWRGFMSYSFWHNNVYIDVYNLLRPDFIVNVFYYDDPRQMLWLLVFIYQKLQRVRFVDLLWIFCELQRVTLERQPIKPNCKGEYLFIFQHDTLI